jgi:biopolymer transport protein ExbB/TolQ
MNLEIFDLLSNASLPVQIILLILVVASVLSWILIFEKFFTLSKATKKFSRDRRSILGRRERRKTIYQFKRKRFN